MSGRGRPASICPWCRSSGGKVTGTVRTTLLTPSFAACTQNEVPPRVEMTLGRFFGKKPQKNSGGSLLTMLKSGR